MTQQGDAVAGELATEKVGIKGYLAFFLTIIFFSGVFSGTDSWWRVFDFSVLNGSFGQLPGANGATTSFRGAGGAGAKDGFLFALELAPSVILSLGIISITDGLGGLRAAQQLMTPVLKPLLGIPGICSLALIANLQNTDAAAGMTKELAQEGEITGLLDWVGHICEPVMALWGLPGEAATVLLAALMSMGGAVGVAASLATAGALTGHDVTVLLPAMYLMGNPVQNVGRCLGTAEVNAKYYPHIITVCVINALLSIWVMQLIV